MRAFALLLCAVAVQGDFVAPSYEVDLDKSAYERWVHVADDLVARRGYENTWAALHSLLEEVLSHKEWKEMAGLWDVLFESYPAFYQEELLAFYRWTHERGHTEWTLGQVVMCQLFYEVEDACTSIVAQNTNGTIYHGRNLDYGLPGLANMTTIITFTKGGERVGRGTMYVGYAGVLTGQKVTGSAAKWSISLDARFYGATIVPYVDTVKEIIAGTQNVGFTLRDAVTSLPDYASALDLLKVKPIPAPAYLIVGGLGNNEGAVITRDRNGTSHAAGTGRGFWPIDTAAGDFYRLETNFDNWEPFTDGRRKIANEGMRANGQAGANLTGLLDVLSSDKVLNNETTYTALMQNDADYYYTLARTPDQADEAARREAFVHKVRKSMQQLLAWYREQPFYKKDWQQ
eukprot:TRINITY_DN12176_c0_g1_i1.p1 TRINITY_DN12176_c0_g1~~TRINITY_DN12176_c0_g1_i1.p1  ORF type:complete len:441 (+),score=179.64 TRINITY_DN12176_c0_g1_i1:120-1325(+)